MNTRNNLLERASERLDTTRATRGTGASVEPPSVTAAPCAQPSVEALNTLGEHPVTPNDHGLLASLRQRAPNHSFSGAHPCQPTEMEEQFAKRFPIGSKIKYFPLIDEQEFVEAEIRSEPWQLGHGAIVVKITGRSGGVCIEHIQEAS